MVPTFSIHLRTPYDPAVDHSPPLGPELAEFKYTRQIFEQNFLGNETSREKMPFFLFDFFLRVERRTSGGTLCINFARISVESNTFPRVNRIARNNFERALKANVASTRAFLCSIRLIESFRLPFGYRFVEIVTGCFARIARIYRAKYPLL